MPRPGSKVLTSKRLAAVAGVEDRARPDHCTITIPGRGRVWDPDLRPAGGYVDAPSTTVFDGDCRATPAPPSGQHTEHGDQGVATPRWFLSIDGATTGVVVGADVVFDRATDPNLLGRHVTVVETVGSSSPTAARFVLAATEARTDG